MDFNDLQIGNKRLTFETTTDEDGNIIYKPGDKKHNQTIDIKNAVKKQVDLIVDTLNAEGAAIDDDSFLDQSALKDLRFYALRKATTAGMYLQQFNTACTDLVKASKLLNDFLLDFFNAVDNPFNSKYIANQKYFLVLTRKISAEITEHVKITTDKFGDVSLNIFLINEDMRISYEHI